MRIGERERERGKEGARRGDETGQEEEEELLFTGTVWCGPLEVTRREIGIRRRDEKKRDGSLIPSSPRCFA